jgi:ribulose-5-phosphate 4-epimerase/fuculose-1-phosphate aldolase
MTTQASTAAKQQPTEVLGIGRELTIPQQLACALRILAAEGWQEWLSGHITWVEEGSDTMWCNPWGIWWEETKASDIVRVTLDGDVVEGKWPATSAVFIHTELHRQRPDARVVVHGHPYYTTLLAGMGETPEVIHQNTAIFHNDIAYVDEYDGFVSDASSGAQLAERIGSATGVVLANHGAIVTGETVGEACYQSVLFERMSKFHYDTMVAGRKPKAIPDDIQAAMKAGLKKGATPIFWDGAVRRLLRTEPDVLD